MGFELGCLTVLACSCGVYQGTNTPAVIAAFAFVLLSALTSLQDRVPHNPLAWPTGLNKAPHQRPVRNCPGKQMKCKTKQMKQTTKAVD